MVPLTGVVLLGATEITPILFAINRFEVQIGALIEYSSPRLRKLIILVFGGTTSGPVWTDLALVILPGCEILLLRVGIIRDEMLDGGEPVADAAPHIPLCVALSTPPLVDTELYLILIIVATYGRLHGYNYCCCCCCCYCYCFDFS